MYMDAHHTHTIFNKSLPIFFFFVWQWFAWKDCIFDGAGQAFCDAELKIWQKNIMFKQNGDTKFYRFSKHGSVIVYM